MIGSHEPVWAGPEISWSCHPAMNLGKAALLAPLRGFSYKGIGFPAGFLSPQLGVAEARLKVSLLPLPHHQQPPRPLREGTGDTQAQQPAFGAYTVERATLSSCHGLTGGKVKTLVGAQVKTALPTPR